MSTLLVNDSSLVMMHNFMTGTTTTGSQTLENPLGLRHTLNRHGFTPYTFALACAKYNWIACDRHNEKRTWGASVEDMYKRILQREYNLGGGVYQTYKTIQCYLYNNADIEGWNLLSWLDAKELEEYYKHINCLKELERGLGAHIISYMEEYKKAVWG